MTERQKLFLLSTRVSNCTPGWTLRTIDIKVFVHAIVNVIKGTIYYLNSHSMSTLSTCDSHQYDKEILGLVFAPVYS